MNNSVNSLISVHNNCLKVTTLHRTANLCSLKKKIRWASGNQHKHNYNSLVRLGQFIYSCLILSFLHKFFSALQHLKHCCHIIGTQHSVCASNHCNSHVHGYGKKAYILKYLLDFKNNLINNVCATLYPLSMTYITVYYLSINSDYHNLAAELNYRFTTLET